MKQFEDYQDNDIDKTLIALRNGFRVIRIDYNFNTVDQITNFLWYCFDQDCGWNFAISDKHIYKDMLSCVKKESDFNKLVKYTKGDLCYRLYYVLI